jgi:hypothetical protein
LCLEQIPDARMSINLSVSAPIPIALPNLMMRTHALDPWLSITTDPTPRGKAGSARAQSEAPQKHEHDDY